ncbi:uncharacterized protein LOC118171951 [Oxyura jamaicensis]|uniref:uncharacterized protein LOC118171951 n=1 Tax=Oxyura jamaicensis TaxID=8884 RepID=UPI0015A5B8D3|nr:uncharacterized protein LOC118171951 [Oxyura jamaicensis]
MWAPGPGEAEAACRQSNPHLNSSMKTSLIRHQPSPGVCNIWNLRGPLRGWWHHQLVSSLGDGGWDWCWWLEPSSELSPRVGVRMRPYGPSKSVPVGEISVKSVFCKSWLSSRFHIANQKHRVRSQGKEGCAAEPLAQGTPQGDEAEVCPGGLGTEGQPGSGVTVQRLSQASSSGDLRWVKTRVCRRQAEDFTVALEDARDSFPQSGAWKAVNDPQGINRQKSLALLHSIEGNGKTPIYFGGSNK